MSSSSHKTRVLGLTLKRWCKEDTLHHGEYTAMPHKHQGLNDPLQAVNLVEFVVENGPSSPLRAS